MIRKRKIVHYYMKKQGFTKQEADKTADKTQPEFTEARNVYLSIFKETKPTFADRTEREKILRVYQVFSLIALFCYIIWLFLNGYLNHARVSDNFLLIILLINLAIVSILNEKISGRIHDRKLKNFFNDDPEALKKLIRVETIKRDIFRAEQREIKLVEASKEAQANESEEKQNKIIETIKKIISKKK
ncbi:hypothetical protein [Enterococcus xiangfangensis]|uniref:SMODS and SLOG-associating 2TM effector domain-containing protein n=1 Tax=Enterococcus xiangfangensis TaxID=1296537 RepID=A0ABU3FF48_9ENTE|nr:hypothetical protein [Enterococcus xiangfangensis]MBM7711775.1 hypothetical protein [Enterococcus xiangfangensis]MDT2760672.1 hypothetical protein [Enterococcus xiangfangensis]